jgi:hypothetical protein
LNAKVAKRIWPFQAACLRAGIRWGRNVEEKESDCLHCDINDVVRNHIEQNTPANLPELVAKVGESLVDLILLGPKEEWANLLAEAVSHIGHVFLEKNGAAKSDTTH